MLRRGLKYIIPTILQKVCVCDIFVQYPTIGTGSSERVLCIICTVNSYATSHKKDATSRCPLSLLSRRARLYPLRTALHGPLLVLRNDPAKSIRSYFVRSKHTLVQSSTYYRCRITLPSVPSVSVSRLLTDALVPPALQSSIPSFSF
jgi:hypothetical protein